MTTSQINKAYDRFIIVVTSTVKGITKTYEEEVIDSFSRVKKNAISELTGILDAHYGRGEHTITIYGARQVNVTTPEEHKVGFGPKWVTQKGQELFKL